MNFDPSKLNPQTLTELTDLMRSLTPEQMMKMQTLMHNTMAGMNVQNDMMEFEKSLPPNFREKMARLMYLANGIEVPAEAPSISLDEVPSISLHEAPKNEDEARLVILRSVAGGMISPEEAIKVLFPN